jgi:D-glycero-alpha-D-manno-heptose-7-phosphate kinase
MKEALLKGTIRRFAEVLEQGWLSKKKTAEGVTNDNSERIYDAALNGGAYAGKVSGRSMMFIVDPLRCPDVFRVLHCQQVTRCQFSSPIKASSHGE